jgi:hypothetical protein
MSDEGEDLSGGVKPLWTHDRIMKMIELRNSGLTLHQIANELGDVSRNGVISKLTRLPAEYLPLLKVPVSNERKPKIVGETDEQRIARQKEQRKQLRIRHAEKMKKRRADERAARAVAGVVGVAGGRRRRVKDGESGSASGVGCAGSKADRVDDGQLSGAEIANWMECWLNDGGGVTLLDLTIDKCPWPMWDSSVVTADERKYCGRRVVPVLAKNGRRMTSDGAYCDHHTKLKKRKANERAVGWVDRKRKNTMVVRRR